LVDRDFDGDRASHGNAGGIAVSECLPLSLRGLGLQPLRWLIDPLGPLSVRASYALRLLPWFRALRAVSVPARYQAIAKALAALNDRSLADFRFLLGEIGLSGDLHTQGALTVYESTRTFQEEIEDWNLRRSLGVRWREVETEELHVLEPNLSPVFERAVMLEDWAHIDDPKRIVAALRASVRERGASLVTGEAIGLHAENGEKPAVLLDGGRRLEADRLLVAAGAWSDRLSRTIGDRALVESERGYNTTLPQNTGLLNREVIFAERKFVATPLSVGLRIGGAAEFAGLEAPANFKRSDALLRLARRYLNNLDEHGCVRWMGQRPTMPDSLPVICASPRRPRVLYAFGHGHLGLTQAATTGELIGHLLDGTPLPIDIAPYDIGRFARTAHNSVGRFDADVEGAGHAGGGGQ